MADESENMVQYEGRRVYRRPAPFLTYALIAVDIIIYGLLYLWSLRSGSSYDQLLSVYGSKINSDIINGQYWRFITPVFLHANLVHLLINCYSLYVVGVTVERVYGHARFAAIYFFAGIIGNIFSFMFSINNGVGASGAIFGLMGALVYLGVVRPSLFKESFGYSVIATIVINLGYGFSNSGIDNFAHIGGLVGGFFASGAIRPGGIGGKWYHNKALYVAAAFAVTAGGLLYGFSNANNIAMGKLDKIQTYINSNNYAETETAAESVLAVNPGNAEIKSDAMRALVWAEASAGKLDEALQHAQQMINVDPPGGHYFTGLVYYDLKRYAEAKSELQQAKELKAPYSNIDAILSSIESLTAK